MEYLNIKKGLFIDRPNRFIANIQIDGIPCVCHVKNTGRCKELLQKGATVYVEQSSNPNRKTAYDLISVYKNKILINMDSQAPNKVFFEWLKAEALIKNITFIKPEYKFGNSRIDFYAEAEDCKYLIEVKGVTLEENGVVMFPDAPTQRGLKHIHELIEGTKQGYTAYIVFVVQMSGAKYFTPNKKTHPEFAKALTLAQNNNVNILALCCNVTATTLSITKQIPIIL